MWRIEEVPALLKILEPIADRNGFLVSVYGSVVQKGTGRDLDLIFVQKRINVSPKWLLADIAKTLEGIIEKSERSLFAELCGLVRLENGRLLDIQIRLSKCAPKDALDLYEATTDNRVIWKKGWDP